jgi:hypothetical protein
MSKESTAKLSGIVTARVAPVNMDKLKTMGTVTALNTISWEYDLDWRTREPRLPKKVAEMTVDPTKGQFIGSLRITMGTIKQLVAFYLQKDGKVRASSDSKVGNTSFYQRLQFVSAEDEAAWNAFLGIAPSYFTQAGII